jgi:hypothetical protein
VKNNPISYIDPWGLCRNAPNRVGPYDLIDAYETFHGPTQHPDIHTTPFDFSFDKPVTFDDRSYPEWLLREIGPSDNEWAPWVTGEREIEVIMWTPTYFIIRLIGGDIDYWPPFNNP